MFHLRLRKRFLLWLFGPLIGFLVNLLALPVFVLLILVVTVAALKGSSLSFSATAAQTTVQYGAVGQSWNGQKNQPIVDAALLMAPYLHGVPDAQYADIPQAALDYWQATCPPSRQCWQYWQSGSLQCVLFVAAAYGLAHQDLPYAPDAVLFWDDYRAVPGWQELTANAPYQPWPGDLIVWSGGELGLGHIAIVTDVKLPKDSQDTSGYIAFAEANGPAPLTQQMLTMDDLGNLTVHTWSGYHVLGYIRHSSFFSAS